MDEEKIRKKFEELFKLKGQKLLSVRDIFSSGIFEYDKSDDWPDLRTDGRLKVDDEFNIRDEFNNIIAETTPQLHDVGKELDEERIANAHHLVRCWNGHDRMVEITRNAVKTLRCTIAFIEMFSEDLHKDDPFKVDYGTLKRWEKSLMEAEFKFWDGCKREEIKLNPTIEGL